MNLPDWFPCKLIVLALRGWKCARCNYPVAQGDKTCENCGQPLKWPKVKEEKFTEHREHKGCCNCKHEGIYEGYEAANSLANKFMLLMYIFGILMGIVVGISW